jgi:PPOX class probable F420-dependent enzyme
MPSLEQLASEKYVLLTTFRRDGRAVPTPIWVMPDGDGMAFWTVRDSGKVKRIRNSGRVTITACDMRGKPRGETVEATARLGDAGDKPRVVKALTRKYGLVGRLSMIGSRLRRGADGTVIILVS